MTKLKALLTTIPSDSHQWNLVFMQLFLEENMVEVINLGPNVTYDLLETACTQHLPDLIIVSTVNGHGYIEGKELIRRIQQIDSMTGKPVFMGGKLSTDANLSYLYAMELEQAGYKKVYSTDQDLSDFALQLQQMQQQRIFI